MSSKINARRKRIRGYGIAAFVVFLCGLSPMPFGLGLIYPIWDIMRGHPRAQHGTQPARFIGFWLRDEPVTERFKAQAFYLMPDGKVAGIMGMTQRRWHYDNDRLFIDSRSMCGSCYQGTVVRDYSIKFVGADQLIIAGQNSGDFEAFEGRYRRLKITDKLRSDLVRQKESKDDEESFRARRILEGFKQIDSLLKEQ